MSQLHQDFIDAGYICVQEEVDGVTIYTWEHPEEGHCTVCGCPADYCNGPTDRLDMEPDTSACDCYDEELGEANC